MNDFLTLGPDGRVAEHEGKTLDYKRDLSGPEGVLRTVVAFANSAGGRLVIGVVDDRSVVGVDDPVTAEMRLADLNNGLDTPPIASHHRTHHPRWQDRARRQRAGRGAAPILSEGGGPIRRRLCAPRLLQPAGHQAVDGRSRPGGGLADLRSADQPAGRYRRHRPAGAGAASRPAHRRGGTAHPGTGRTRERTSAPDPEWNWRRRDVSSIPEAAIRELVVNALVHSSYSYGGTAIKVVFYDRAIVVESPGGLVPGVTIEQITHGVSVQRNPALARVFRQAGLVEPWGMGLRTVIRDLADGGYEPPDIEELHERLRVAVRIPDHDPRYFTPARPRTGENGRGLEPRIAGPTPGERARPVEHAHASSNDRRQEGKYDVVMMRAAADGPVHRDTLLAAAGLRPLSQNYARHVVPLLSSRLLAMTVPDKPRSKAQRYVLTEAGRVRLAEHDSEERPR